MQNQLARKQTIFSLIKKWLRLAEACVKRYDACRKDDTCQFYITKFLQKCESKFSISI